MGSYKMLGYSYENIKKLNMSKTLKIINLSSAILRKNQN